MSGITFNQGDVFVRMTSQLVTSFSTLLLLLPRRCGHRQVAPAAAAAAVSPSDIKKITMKHNKAAEVLSPNM